MTNEQERAEFEAGCLERHPTATFGRFPISGQYNNDWIEHQWVGYQAGRAATQSQKPEPVVTLVEARDEAMRFALSEMVKWYEDISLGNNPAFQYYDFTKKALQPAASQSQAMPYAGTTVWIGDKRCSYGIAEDELELSIFDILQAAFDYARSRVDEEGKWN